jgi:CHAT domain-containing protein/tetratricopeptide (TPR) repeat protein
MFFFTPIAMAADEGRWEELISQAIKLYQAGRYAEAIPFAQEGLRVAEATWNADDHHVGASLNALASLYHREGRYGDAEPLYRRGLGILEKALGPDHPDLARSLDNLASLYATQGRHADAEPLLRRSLGIWEKALGPDHPDVASLLNNLARLYRTQGRYDDAEPLELRSLAIREKALGPDHPDVATSLVGLALLHKAHGRYGDAEPLLRRSVRINEKALGPDHPEVALALNNLAEGYRDQGRYADAEPLLRRCLAINEKALGPGHPDVALALNNLAGLYYDQGRYGDAEPLYRRSLGILEKELRPDHPAVATSLNNLALLYKAQGRYGDAEPLLRRSLEIDEKALGPDHPSVALALNNLASVYGGQGRHDDAEPLFRRSLAIREKALGPDHPDVATSLYNLAFHSYARGERVMAEDFFGRTLESIARQFVYHFSYMTERERLAFLETVSGHFQAFFSFCFTYRNDSPALLGKMYDTVLWRKGFIATSLAALRSRIEATGDKASVALFEQLSEKRTQLAHLVTAKAGMPGVTRERIAELEQQAQAIEKDLVQRVSSLAEEKRLARVTWKDVRQGLKPGEAAVELVRFDFHDGKEQTGKAYYAALIVTPESQTAPTFVLLGDAKELEDAGLTDYRDRTRDPKARMLMHEDAASPAKPASSTAAAANPWKPLEAALGQAKRIYLSPDGLLHQVAWGLLSKADGSLLLESVDLRLVSSTKDILRTTSRSASTQQAVLVGNPTFGMTEASQRTAARRALALDAIADSTTRSLRSREGFPAHIKPLPGTQAEVDSLRTLFQGQRWTVETLTEDKAIEEAVKSLKAPRVLHLATHGFFLADQQMSKDGSAVFETEGRPPRIEDPMLRSGIVLAGAERAFAGQANAPGLDDGVLTAYEAMSLNLQGTELVTLSACETGLGDVKAGEGVFGLRRGLEVAGAEAVLMSLWAVPDRETQELMSSFYRRWLAGEEKHQALRKAQLEMRQVVKERYGRDLPYYWGAFVLVGR